jgi:hypothetical protein
VIGKANRIGVKLTGNIHCLAPRAARPSTGRPRRPAIARRAVVETQCSCASRAASHLVRPSWVGECSRSGSKRSRSACGGRLAIRQASSCIAAFNGEGPSYCADIAGWPISHRVPGLGRLALRARVDRRVKSQQTAAFWRWTGPRPREGDALVRARSFAPSSPSDEDRLFRRNVKGRFLGAP